jgi:hypothetical protein
MVFEELMYFMLGMVKDSTQNALSRFFRKIGKEDVHMSQQAFRTAKNTVGNA